MTRAGDERSPPQQRMTHGEVRSPPTDTASARRASRGRGGSAAERTAPAAARLVTPAPKARGANGGSPGLGGEPKAGGGRGARGTPPPRRGVPQAPPPTRGPGSPRGPRGGLGSPDGPGRPQAQ
ncbi:unnamed protein product [Arctia plantaginis]|uniref:Uncharacterized protein n=1 Tax=Arctia plantaginis TaxID=874455 RepID=A0A8S0YTD4_ARCPL|nr:unnamed protein product [Arctia plantaginis]